MRPEVEALLSLARTLPAEELASLMGDLEQIRVVALVRLTTPAKEQQDEMLDVEQASKRMRVSKDYLYRHARRFKFTRREGRKLLFSSAGLDSYLKKAR